MGRAAKIFALDPWTETDRRTENDTARAERGGVSRAGGGIGYGGAVFAPLPTACYGKGKSKRGSPPRHLAVRQKGVD